MADSTVPVAVLGASGFSGAELLRLLASHPRFEPAFLGAHDAAGTPVTDLYPHLQPYEGRSFEAVGELDPNAVQAVLAALPASESANIVPGLLEAGLRVVDLGGDFRLAAEDYPRWYGFDHPSSAWLDKAVYGLTELFRDQVKDAALVANPGCYPTPVVLGLAPLFQAGLVTGHVVVDGKSGISGAGKKLTWQSHFASLDGSVQAYRIGRHQHTPEMERALATVTGGGQSVPPKVTFVPHLVPTVRGIVTTAYVQMSDAIADGHSEASADTLRDTLANRYADEAFVRVLGPGLAPDPKRLTGTNVCELTVEVDAHTGTAVVIGAIDNLGKGAAGQALQNLNAMLGLDETLGLSAVGVYP
jgi:N-acetyl-gamma-glutamyl-phosphate reductase